MIDNCGISFGNDFKNVAFGDSEILHCQFSIVNLQPSAARQTGIGTIPHF